MPVSQYENLAAERLVTLKHAGAAPVEAIKALHSEFGLSLAEAKQAFARSPAWTAEVAAGDVLHAETMQSDGDSDSGAQALEAGIQIPKNSKYPFLRLITWYVVLSPIMVVAKFLEERGTGGDGYSVVANVLGLVLLLPWNIVAPGGRLGQGINSAQWFLLLSLLNLFLLLGFSALKRRSLRRHKSLD